MPVPVLLRLIAVLSLLLSAPLPAAADCDGHLAASRVEFSPELGLAPLTLRQAWASLLSQPGPYRDLYLHLQRSAAGNSAEGFASDLFDMRYVIHRYQGTLHLQIGLIQFQKTPLGARAGKGLSVAFGKILYTVAAFIREQVARDPELHTVKVGALTVRNEELAGLLRENGFSAYLLTLKSQLVTGAFAAGACALITATGADIETANLLIGAAIGQLLITGVQHFGNGQLTLELNVERSAGDGSQICLNPRK